MNAQQKKIGDPIDRGDVVKADRNAEKFVVVGPVSVCVATEPWIGRVVQRKSSTNTSRKMVATSSVFTVNLAYAKRLAESVVNLWNRELFLHVEFGRVQ